ncbi:hypothetical protein C0993_010109 [Termitomyces sp. T159_Od127]|nr:hypothetical protein C0993_010109 [Termitomyces sp. T159_Od127]
MRISQIRTQSAISKLLSRPSSRCSHRSSTSSHSSSPLYPSPLSLSLSANSSESEPPDSVKEEDLTKMDFLSDSDDIVPEDNGGVVEQSLDTMDPEYYMEMILFKIEDVLFRVPIHLFKSCTDFFDPLLDEMDNVHEDKKVIIQDDVSKKDFRALLKLLYPISFTLTRTLSDDEWISVLRVSTTWRMLDIRRMAIEHLTSAPISLVDRIFLAREYSVISWLRSAYLALVEVNSELSRHDELTTEIIGLESSFKLHRVRESVLPSRQGNAHVIDREIEKDFETEFEALSDQTSIELAVLAQKYGVSEWRRNAFVAMVRRKQLLAVDEAQALGFETSIRLCGARELRRTLGAEQAVKQELEWDFNTLKSHTVVERLIMARDYGVRNWVKESLLELAEREESLSMPEAHDIGLRTAIALCRARHYTNQLSPDEAIYRQALELEFGEEFELVEAAGRQLLSQVELEKLEELSVVQQWLNRRLQEQQEPEEALDSREIEEQRGSLEDNQKAQEVGVIDRQDDQRHMMKSSNPNSPV